MKGKTLLRSSVSSVVLAAVTFGFGQQAGHAQDMLPYDNGLATYHTSPRYRESESHPLRIFAYIVHPIGWLAREAITRPLSYFAGSTETTRSVFGYREPFDFRSPECFSADESAPDCRSVNPFNYDGPSSNLGSAVATGALEDGGGESMAVAQKSVYFPDVNFDFNKRALNDLGKGQSHQIAQALKSKGSVQIVLQGHTDFIGSDGYNEKLGMDRAEAVRAELVSQGVSGDQLSTVTFGKTQPIFTDETNWARAVNRRVEVHVADGK